MPSSAAFLLQTLVNYPLLVETVNIDQLVTFIDLVRHLKERILWNQSSQITSAPIGLPLTVHSFIRDALGLDDLVTKLLWEAFRCTAWEDHTLAALIIHQRSVALLPLFLKYGPAYGIAFHEFFPPFRSCIDPQCQRHYQGADGPRDLTEPNKYATTVLTKDFGALPSYNTSLYCRKCHTRYYHNYRVHTNATFRTYYHGVPRVIQVSQRFFIESSLCEVFATMMNCAWTSATNCARIYNRAFAPECVKRFLPSDWKPKLHLYYDDVWDSFFIHSLLLDHTSRSAILQLPHQAKSQADRLRPALEERNQRMMGTGQEQWNHACDKCTHVFTGTDGTRRVIRSTVTDGVTLGHPCCAGAIDCKVPLPNNRSMYCPEHEYKKAFCAVLTCNTPVSHGFKTCDRPDHRACEDYHRMMGKAMFQLKSRLERNKVSQPHSAVPNDPSDAFTSEDGAGHGGEGEGGFQESEGAGLHDEDVLVSGAGDVEPTDRGAPDANSLEAVDNAPCPSKSDTGNRPVRARFGRKRTHNEELCVASCGVILGRATFYGSEGPNGVRLFWRGLFPTQASLPNVLWMDSNCQISSMLSARGDTYFQKCALPVDVFHYKCKHKKSDTWCTQNCNPALWPELVTQSGEWRFNSSAAEQTNAWIGGFLAIVREMRVDRYNFFLDEMIRRRNNMLVDELDSKGHSPYLIPREDLLRAD